MRPYRNQPSTLLHSPRPSLRVIRLELLRFSDILSRHHLLADIITDFDFSNVHNLPPFELNDAAQGIIR